MRKKNKQRSSFIIVPVFKPAKYTPSVPVNRLFNPSVHNWFTEKIVCICPACAGVPLDLIDGNAINDLCKHHEYQLRKQKMHNLEVMEKYWKELEEKRKQKEKAAAACHERNKVYRDALQPYTKNIDLKVRIAVSQALKVA